jgi:hypothetical protein
LTNDPAGHIENKCSDLQVADRPLYFDHAPEMKKTTLALV